MGLGPSYCVECEVLHVYIPNKENPKQQGEWVCPFNQWHTESFLFVCGLEQRNRILVNTQIIKENEGQSFPDK